MLIINTLAVLTIIFCLTKLIFSWVIEYDSMHDQIILHYTFKKQRITIILIK